MRSLVTIKFFENDEVLAILNEKLAGKELNFLGQNAMLDHISQEVKKLDCEVLIIGSGAGGATVGSELAEADLMF